MGVYKGVPIIGTDGPASELDGPFTIGQLHLNLENGDLSLITAVDEETGDPTWSQFGTSGQVTATSVRAALITAAGYNASGTQFLKHVNGVLTWGAAS